MKLTWPPQRMNRRSMMVVPLVIAVALTSLTVVLGLPLGREFDGGTLVMVRNLETVPSAAQVKSQVESTIGSAVELTAVTNGFDIFTYANSGDVKNQITSTLTSQLGINENLIIAGLVGPSVGSAQISQMVIAGVGAFAVIGIFIFILRRSATVMAVLFVALLNIVGILGLMAIFRVPLSTASILAVPITIAYAIDSNILLASRLLKGFVGDLRENVGGTVRQGVTVMAVTLAILLTINFFTTAGPLNDFTLALACGVTLNVVNSWFLGAAIILRNVERKKVVS